MKMLRLIPLAFAAMLLSACGTTLGTVADGLYTVVSGGTVASVAPVTLGDAEKALTIAHNLVNYAGVELLYNATPVEQGGSGLLHGQAATDAKTVYDKAVGYLDVADQADQVANTSGILTAVGAVQGLVAQFKALGLAAPPGVTPPATH